MESTADFHFDGWTLVRASGELLKDDKRIRLQDQPLQVLTALLNNPGEVVTREQLIALLWPKGIVDFDIGLNSAVRKVRAALGDEADTPRYIETLPRKGYRFIGAITPVPASATVQPIPAQVLAQPPDIGPPRKLLVWAAAAAVLGCLGVGIALLIPSTPRPATTATARPPIAESLAVLPFRPLVPEARDAALEFGMTDTLITQLSNLPGVRIRPLSTVRSFNTMDQDPLAAGRELQVDTVLDGSIQLDQTHIRVNARLLRVTDGRALWSGKFDAPKGDIFAVQDAIAKQVVDALAVSLSPAAERRLHYQHTSNTQAYQAYVSGLYKWQRRMPEAVQDFETALHLDPDYALAWAGLSSALTAQGVFGFEPPDKVFPRAKQAALRAVTLDAELAEAHSALGHILVQYEHRFAEGERYYLQSLQLNKYDAPTWQRLAIDRAYQGRTRQALADMQHAQALEPTTLSMNANVASMLYFNAAYEESRSRITSVLELDPHYAYAHAVLGRTLIETGDIKGALEHFKDRSQPTPGGEGDIGRAYARAGRVSDARAELERLEQRAREGFGVAYDVATIHAALGETEQACAALIHALEDHSQLVGYLQVDPAMSKVRDAPCVREVERQLYGQ